MRPFVFFLLLAFFVSVVPLHAAHARSGSAGGGGGNTLKAGREGASHARSSGSHKSGNGYIVRHCKTGACFKKHPSGTYGFYSGHKKE